MPAYPITAWSLCNGLGPDVASVVAAMRAGQGALRAHDFEGLEVIAGMVEDLPPLPAKLAAWDTRQARLTHATMVQLDDAIAAARRRWGAPRLAIVVGTSTGGIEATERAYRGRMVDGVLPEGYDVARRHAMQATVEVIRFLSGARGPGYVISTACSSSAKALGAAQRLLAAGVADAVIAGGVDSLCRMTLRGFASLELVSSRPCRPFSSARDGITLGEGGALLLVERQGHSAVELVAVGESNDAHHMSAPHPEGLGAVLAMQRALARAGLEPERVSWVNAHGTGTRLNDEAEARALAQVFPGGIEVVATKGYTGHLLGAAGATEAVLTAISIEEGWIPGSLGAEPVDPLLGIDVLTTSRTRESDWVLSNSFAFGGSNVAVLLGARQA